MSFESVGYNNFTLLHVALIYLGGCLIPCY